MFLNLRIVSIFVILAMAGMVIGSLNAAPVVGLGPGCLDGPIYAGCTGPDIDDSISVDDVNLDVVDSVDGDGVSTIVPQYLEVNGGEISTIIPQY